MLRPRVIPCLLLRGEGLVKGVRFSNYKYVGDPINAVRIFSEKEVDELLFLDIMATSENRTVAPNFIQKIADECYMPFAIGGGINSVEQVQDLLGAGAEKVSINTAAIDDPLLIRQVADAFGSQSIVVSIDVKRNWRGLYRVYTHSGKRSTRLDPIDWARTAEQLGAGEILLTSIDNDGRMQGYDHNLIQQVAGAVSIPVIACGGAGTTAHLRSAVIDGKASAVAAGSLFVFYGPKRAVLINFPERSHIGKEFC